MKLFRSKRRLAIVCGTTALTLAAAGTAFAYFSATGSGSNTGSVGSAATAFTVAVAAPTGGPLYPGTGLSTDTTDGIETFSYTVTNEATTGNQAYKTVTITVLPTKANCMASWYAINSTSATVGTDDDVINLGTPVNLAPGATSTAATFTLQFVNSATTDQSACEGDTPTVTVAVS